MNTTQVLSRSSEVIEVTVEEQQVLLHSTRWEYLQFDPVGGAIWRMLAEPNSLDSLVATLRVRYAIDEETCRRETEIFVDKLVASEFVVLQG